jgi:hypothetical protein
MYQYQGWTDVFTCGPDKALQLGPERLEMKVLLIKYDEVTPVNSYQHLHVQSDYLNIIHGHIAADYE